MGIGQTVSEGTKEFSILRARSAPLNVHHVIFSRLQQ